VKCPHCGIDFHEDWATASMVGEQGVPVVATVRGKSVRWEYMTTRCSKCRDIIIEIGATFEQTHVTLVKPRMVYPIGANRGPVPPEVPSPIAEDYIEACNALPISAKASAALSRRCLQNILHGAGYKGRDLAAEIDLLLAESDPKKGIPLRLRTTVDGIRHFGNFSAHPINDKTSLQIIDVEPEEAEWCLEMIEEMFEHFYVGPEVAKARKSALDQKLALAGKPPAKG
jgi:Domain of unknown function (DUF4145)